AMARRVVSAGRIGNPAKSGLVDQREPQDQKRRRISGVDGQRAFTCFLCTHMSVLAELGVIAFSLREMLIGKWTARALSPNPRLLAEGQADLQGRDDLLRDLVLQLEHIVQVAVEAVRPGMAAIEAVDQLRRQPDAVAALSYTALQHVADTQKAADLANVFGLALEDEAGMAGNHQEVLDLGQGGYHVLGDA